MKYTVKHLTLAGDMNTKFLSTKEEALTLARELCASSHVIYVSALGPGLQLLFNILEQ